jgi:hypothetical protein
LPLTISGKSSASGKSTRHLYLMHLLLPKHQSPTPPRLLTKSPSILQGWCLPKPLHQLQGCTLPFLQGCIL